MNNIENKTDNNPDNPLPPTRPYRCDEANFELPVELKDKTINVFALKDDGPNEFNLVISRAEIDADTTLDDFADRLTQELKRALPKFQLKRRQEAAIAGSPAVELFYAWSNNGIPMQQRQTATFVQGHDTERPQALMVAATCLNGFTEHWHAVYDRLLASMTLNRPLAAPAANEEEHAPDGSPLAFALARDGTLHVHGSRARMIESVDLLEVKAGLWKFYDADGHPLQVLWIPAALGVLSGEEGRYRLRRAEEGAGLGPLQDRLATIDRVKGHLTELADVHQYLREAAQGPLHA